MADSDDDSSATYWSGDGKQNGGAPNGFDCGVEESCCLDGPRKPFDESAKQFDLLRTNSNSNSSSSDDDDDDDDSDDDNDDAQATKENKTNNVTPTTAAPSNPSNKAKPAKLKPKKDLSVAKRWPQCHTLCLVYPEIVLTILNVCEESRAFSCLKASNSNVKGNGWALAVQVLFGGDRGALSGVMPAIYKATDLKKRVIDICRWVKSNPSHDELSIDVKDKALDLLYIYDAAVKKNEEEVSAHKESTAELERKMSGYEGGNGFIASNQRTGQKDCDS